MPEIKLFEHPDYKTSRDEWEEIRDFYEGDHSVLVNPRYLVMHSLEMAPNGGGRIRAIREGISGYTNFLATVVKSYLALMFRDPIDTSDVAGIFGDNLYNVDAQGMSLQSFIRDCIARNLILYGRPIVRTDTFAVDAKSAGDESKLGQRPIWSIINPLDAKDFQFSQTRLTAFRHEYKVVETRESLFDEPKEAIYTRIYEQQGNAVIVKILKAEGKAEQEKHWSIVSETQLQIPEIPIAGAWNAKTWVRDVKTEQRRHWNLSSDLDNVVHYQAYAIRVAKGIEDQNQRMALSEYTMLFIPRDAEIVQLDPVDPVALKERVSESRRNLFDVAFNMARTPGQDSNAVEGANTIRERKDDIVAFLESQIEVVETVANQAIEHWAMMSNKTPAKIKLSRKLTNQDVQELITLFQALGDELVNYPTWKKRTLSAIAQAQGLGDDKEVKDEIERMEIKKPIQQAQQSPKLLDLIRGRAQETNNQSGQGPAR